jgi:YidC/Oxa1 family membrane protein insertase
MPIFFIPFVIGVPAGVMIYWITTNVWTICQQGVIKRTMGHRLRPATAAAAPAAPKATGSRTPPSPTGRKAQAGGRSRKKRRGGGRRR